MADAELLLRPLTAGPAASDPRAFVGLSEAREAQGDRKGALEALAVAVRIDPKKAKVVGTTQVGAGPTTIAYGDETIWVGSGDSETISRVDPVSGNVTATVPLPGRPSPGKTRQRLGPRIGREELRRRGILVHVGPWASVHHQRGLGRLE